MDAVLPRLAVDLSSGSVDVAGLFAADDGVSGDVRILEIGFGGGEHLLDEAERAPNTGFIGCEPFVNGMAKTVAAIDRQGLTNIRLHMGDAQSLIDALPDDAIDLVYLLYPDPWPKRRHWKRRYVSVETLDALYRVLKPGGEFRFASDIPTYVNWTLAHIRRQGRFVWTARQAADWQTPWQPWSGTRYEEKAQREGRVPAYLTFTKPAR